MEKNNNVLVAGLLMLIIGLFAGYTLAPRTMMDSRFDRDDMHEEMDEMMHYEDDFMSDGAMQHSMDEMMRGFNGKTGEAFEKAFLEMMIVHHLGAIEMAERLLEETDRPELVQMANDIISAQTREVDMMKKWLKDWFNA